MTATTMLGDDIILGIIIVIYNCCKISYSQLGPTRLAQCTIAYVNGAQSRAIVGAIIEGLLDICWLQI